MSRYSVFNTRPRKFWKMREVIFMKENKFQSDLIKEIKERFDGCIVTKLDSEHIKGIQDLLVLYKDKWATLEWKRNCKASHRPNQEYYVNKMNEMSFSRFVYPENKEAVLDELQQSFKAWGLPRFLKR